MSFIFESENHRKQILDNAERFLANHRESIKLSVSLAKLNYPPSIYFQYVPEAWKPEHWKWFSREGFLVL